MCHARVRWQIASGPIDVARLEGDGASLIGGLAETEHDASCTSHISEAGPIGWHERSANCGVASARRVEAFVSRHMNEHLIDAGLQGQHGHDRKTDSRRR
jgi:hypothetical protein